MSDNEGAGQKSSTYRWEYSPNNRAACKGPKPCKGTKLAKGEIRFGSVGDFGGHQSWSYRHYGCITSRIIANAKKSYGSVSEIEGWDTLAPEDQAKIEAAWENGKVDPADIPESAKGPEEEEGSDGEPKKKKKKVSRPKKKQKTEGDDEAEDDEPKPKKKAPAKRKSKKKAESDEEEETALSEDEGDASDYDVGKKRKRGGGRKKTKTKTDEED